MDRRVTESERLELENKLLNKLLHRTTEPISVRLGFLESITSNFSKEQEIGSGAYGVVYKGILLCGSVIAVKKFNGRAPAVDDQSFENEASFLMDIKHHNVVQLLGFCAESRGAMMMKQPNGKCIVVYEQTRMLCFEYMCNGGLDKHLSDESSGLEWNTRYKIIKGICSGLKYLHGRNIIHLDLKPQNILMDATMTPKIADFGLSRLLGEQKSHTVTSNRPGTRGYMAPEYTDRGVISKKADIFSLGVIIIEILNGCKDDYPDYRLSTEIDFQHFREKVLSNWRNRFEGSSKYTSPEQHTQLVKQCIDIALECVHPDKEKRPDVSNIIEILNAAKESCFDRNGEDLPVDHQMAIDLLSDVRPRQFHWTICVSISRMWEFHGKSDDRDIKHLDLVIIDKKGTSMYVEIPPDSIPVLKPQLKEGKVVVMKKFVVEPAKPEYKVVPNPYMLRLNKRTMITTVEPEPSMFPKVTYMLTPLSELEQYKGSTERFLDVIGQITQVSDAANFHTVPGTMQMRRKITLRDINGIAINLLLSGARATEFDGDKVYNLGQETAVVAVFVGTLMKKGLAGQPSYLSGTSACRWYINDFQIPAIQQYYNMLPSEVDAVDKIEISDTKTMQQHVHQKMVLQLKDMDPFEQMNTKFQCTVTITKLSLNQGWYYSACKICKTGCHYINDTYKCAKKDCPSNEAQDRYKLCFMAADETYELEFIAFDQKAQQLIGKPLQRLQSMYGKFDAPAEISNLVGQTYTFIVKISARRSMNTDEPSYEVVSIKEQFGKQANVRIFQKTNPLPAAGYFKGTQINLQSPIQIQPKKIQ